MKDIAPGSDLTVVGRMIRFDRFILGLIGIAEGIVVVVTLASFRPSWSYRWVLNHLPTVEELDKPPDDRFDRRMKIWRLLFGKMKRK